MTLPSYARSDARHLLLAHTLAIAKARSEEELLSRTLAAACVAVDASAAIAETPDGRRFTHGDESLADRLTIADAALPTAISASLGDTQIVVATSHPGGLAPDTGLLLALVLAHAQAGRDRLREVELLAQRANSDPLTGLRHLRPFEERLATSSPGHTAVIAFDVDGFKKINDRYGHQAGDHALVTLVDALRAALRDDDQLYRIGGDEFAVVVDVNGLAEARAIARRLLDAARRVGQTVSVGAAMHLPGETGRETLLRADRALYEAKRAGRDTARVAA